MTEMTSKSPAARFSRLFRKAGVLLAKSQWPEALAVFREGEALAQALGDEEKCDVIVGEKAPFKPETG